MEINNTILASASAGLAALFATLVIIDFITYTSNQYKEKFDEEIAVDLDDLFLQMPPSKIFDVSLALGGIVSLLTIFVVGFAGESWSWSKVGIFTFLLGGGAFILPRIYLKYLRKKRLKEFNIQLEDALTSMSSALKAGFSINQAIEVIVNERKRPISVEFRLLVQELRLGIPLEDALQNMVDRIQSEDFELVATAIATARETGGELTVTLERLASMIRERMRIKGKLDAMTAQGKIQAYVIGGMPFLFMFVLTYVAPDMMSAFFNNLIGIIAIIAAGVWTIIGFFVIRKITTIDI